MKFASEYIPVLVIVFRAFDNFISISELQTISVKIVIMTKSLSLH